MPDSGCEDSYILKINCIFSLPNLGLNIDIVYYETIGGGRMAIIGNIVIILFQLDPS